MPRHFFTLSPDGALLVISIGGDRNAREAELAIKAFLKFYADHPVRKVVFDLANAHTDISAPELVAEAQKMGRLIEPCQVAIVGRRLDCPFARLWRRGLEATGHEAMVFDHAGEAEAWLRSSDAADTVYVY